MSDFIVAWFDPKTTNDVENNWRLVQTEDVVRAVEIVHHNMRHGSEFRYLAYQITLHDGYEISCKPHVPVHTGPVN